MNEQEVAKQQAVKERLAEESQRTGTCRAWRVFSLGSNGTAMVSCGLQEYHDKNGDESIMYHITRQVFDDGSAVTFKWPL